MESVGGVRLRDGQEQVHPGESVGESVRVLFENALSFGSTLSVIQESYTTMRGIILSKVKIPMTPQEEDIL